MMFTRMTWRMGFREGVKHIKGAIKKVSYGVNHNAGGRMGKISMSSSQLLSGRSSGRKTH